MTLEEAFGESFLDFGLTLEVGLAFIINLIEGDTKFLVSFIEAGIHPVVHLLPQGAHLGIVLLPFYQHLVSFLNQRSFLLSLFFGLLSG